MAEPVLFKGANRRLTAPGAQEDTCGDLPVADVESSGFPTVMSCWKLSVRERLSVLFRGRVWLGVQGRTQPPVWIDGLPQHVTEVETEPPAMCHIQPTEPWPP